MIDEVVADFAGIFLPDFNGSLLPDLSSSSQVLNPLLGWKILGGVRSIIVDFVALRRVDS